MGRLRAVVLGAGLMGYWHAQAITQTGARLAAVVDVDHQRAERLAARYPGARVLGVEQALRTDTAEVAHVCAPLPSHVPLAQRALRAGLHVLIEKPLAETLEQTAEVLQLAQVHDRLVCPVHQFIFQPGFVRAQSALQRLGPVVHMDATICSQGADRSPEGSRDWLLAEILPHPLALVERVSPGSIRNAVWQVLHPRPGELRASAQIGNASVSLLLSAHGRPTANMLRLIGEHGTVHLDLFHGFSVEDNGTGSRIQKIAHPFAFAGKTLAAASANLVQRTLRRELAYPGLRELLHRFYVAVSTCADAPVSSAETLAVAAARDAIGRLY